MMFTLTQILTISKARRQTGVISTMDTEKEVTKLHKKLEKLNWQLTNNPDLTQTKRQRIEDEVDQIKEQLKDWRPSLLH